MRIYTQNEVRPILMLHKNSYLWNIPTPAWSDENKKEFEILKSGNPGNLEIKIIKKCYVPKCKEDTAPKKVRRISDGKIYRSYQQCEMQNGISRGVLCRILNGHQKKRSEEFEKVI